VLWEAAREVLSAQLWKRAASTRHADARVASEDLCGALVELHFEE
jgi:hypothetical protein